MNRGFPPLTAPARRRQPGGYSSRSTLAADGSGLASVGDGALGLLGGDDRDRQAERLDAVGEVAAEPVRHARRKRGDDDLVEPACFDRLLHGGEGIAVADGEFRVP